MFYVWQPLNISSQDARRHFSSAVQAERETLSRDYGVELTLRKADAASEIHVAGIHIDYEIDGWQGWQEEAGGCVAWSGVAEVEPALRAPGTLVTAATDRPASIGRWPGRYALAAWRPDTARVTVIAGAMGSPPLWFAQGARGFALGSRARVLLELVGREPTLDLDQAALFVAYRHLAGSGSLFSGVHRVPLRKRVTFSAPRPPVSDTYFSLGDFMNNRESLGGWDGAVAAGADGLIGRVTWQHAVSSRPALMLSGGRDSRAIAAAAARTGFTGPCYTSGPKGSADARIGPQVAHALGLRHMDRSYGPADAPTRLLSMEAAHRWIRISEGTSSIRQALGIRRLLRPRAICGTATEAPPRQQLWHGLSGALTRGYYYLPGRALDGPGSAMGALPFVLAKSLPGARLRRDLPALLTPVLQEMEGDLLGAIVSMSQWLDLFFWQNHSGHWGADLMAVTDLTDWHWAPIVDDRIISAILDLDPARKVSGAYLEEVTWRIDARLRRVPYDRRVSRLRWVARQTAKRTLPIIGKVNAPLAARLARRDLGIEGSTILRDFWHEVFLDGPTAWPEIVERGYLDSLMRTDPTSDVLWNLATVETFARSLGR